MEWHAADTKAVACSDTRAREDEGCIVKGNEMIIMTKMMTRKAMNSDGESDMRMMMMAMTMMMRI